MVKNTFPKSADASKSSDGVFRISPITYQDGKLNGDFVPNTGKVCIEDAIKATGHGRFHLFLLVVCGIGLMCVVVENVNIGFVLPYIRCEMTISTTEQGFLNSVEYIGIVISSHFWEFLADTTGRRRVLMISMCGSFTSAILSAFSFNVISLILTRLLVGIFVSGVQAATYSYIGEFHSNETRTRALSFVAMFMPACFVYLPLIAWTIIPMEWEFNLFDTMMIWRIYLLCSSLLNGINFLCLCQLPESPKFLLSMNRKEETLNVLRRMYVINMQRDVQTYQVEDLVIDSTGTALSKVHGIYGILKLVWNQTWPLFQQRNVANTFKLCFLMFVLFSIGHGTFMWYPDFLTQMQDYTDGSYTLCSVVGTGSVMARSAFNGNLSLYSEVNETPIFEEFIDCNVDRTNTLSFRIILLMGVTFVTVSALIISWLLICSGFSVSIPLIPHFYIMAVCFMIFLSCGLCAGIISAISVTIFPTNIRAMATCLILMFGRLGAAGGSNFVGLLLDGHCELIFYLYACLILSCACVCFFLNTNPVEPSPTTKDKSIEIRCESYYQNKENRISVRLRENSIDEKRFVSNSKAFSCS